MLLVTIPIAAIAGDQTGYWIGRKVRTAALQPARQPLLQARVRRPDRGILRKHGPRAIILARFVLIVRAFVPVMAGTSHMHYRTFRSTTSSVASSGAPA